MYSQGYINNGTSNNGAANGGVIGGGANKKKKIVIIVIFIVIIVALSILLTVLLTGASEQESPEMIKRDDTMTLQLYSKLSAERMTLGELKQEVAASGINAEIMADDGGSGLIRIPESSDAILFSIDREVEEEYVSEEDDSDVTEVIGDEDGDGFTDDFTLKNVIDSYADGDSVYDIAYSYNYNTDYAVGLYCSEEDNVYIVFNGIEEFTFPTKKEAIDEYLAPYIMVEDGSIDE
jgi:hypothetical protein